MKKVSKSRKVSCCAMFFIVPRDSCLELACFHDYFKHRLWQSSLELENRGETCLAPAQTTQTPTYLLFPVPLPGKYYSAFKDALC